MDNLRFFEIYRSSEYLGLLFDGILIDELYSVGAPPLRGEELLQMRGLGYRQLNVPNELYPGTHGPT